MDQMTCYTEQPSFVAFSVSLSPRLLLFMIPWLRNIRSQPGICWCCLPQRHVCFFPGEPRKLSCLNEQFYYNDNTLLIIPWTFTTLPTCVLFSLSIYLKNKNKHVRSLYIVKTLLQCLRKKRKSLLNSFVSIVAFLLVWWTKTTC